MSQPAILEEKKERTTTLLKERWPHLPNEVVNNAIDICFWCALFQSTNRYTTKRALDDFGTMASEIIEQRKVLSCGVIE